MAGPLDVPIYGPDLAHVHDDGFGSFARDAAPGIVAMLREARIEEGLVVDLGCGSGILAGALGDAGYDVLGVDISPDALAMARRRAPRARFVEASALDFELPSCVAVTAVGEVLGYAADPRAGRDALRALYARVANALSSGGLLLFDLAGPGREPVPRRDWREGEGWLICHENFEDAERGELHRRISVFRDSGDGWRRSDEEHVLRLQAPEIVIEDLSASGFEAQTIDRYAPYATFPPGLSGFHAVHI